MTDSGPMPLDHRVQRRKVTFDPTINLGHVLTALAFLGTSAVGYFDLRERISNNEIRTQAVATELQAEKARNEKAILAMGEDVREVRRGVNEILRSMPKGK